MSPAHLCPAGRPVATSDVCGGHAMFGFTAAAPSHDLITGRWYCHAHWRERMAREKAAAQPTPATTPTTDLFRRT